MKEKFKGFFKSKLFFAFILNLAVIAFCIGVTSFSYDSADDFYNSVYICHYRIYYNNEINYILSVIVGSLQFTLGSFNCFVLTLVILAFIAFITITYVFENKFGKPKATVFSLLVNILFALNHYADIASEKTSALILVSGFLLVLNSIRNKKYNLPCWIGVAQIMFGMFLSIEYFLIAFAFAIAFFIADMISKRKHKIPFRKFFWYFRPFLLMFILIGLIGVGLYQYSYSVNHSSDESSDYYEYSRLCDSVSSLPFPDYDEYKDIFSSVGISSKNSYELLKSNYYDSDKTLNNKALALVSKIQQEENRKNFLDEGLEMINDNFTHIAYFDSYAFIITAFAAVAVFFTILHKRRFLFFPLIYIITAIASGIFIRYCYASENYRIYGIWLIMFVMLLYSFDFENKRKFKKLSFENHKRIYISSAIILALLFGGYAIRFYISHTGQISGNRPSSLYTEIAKHPERLYILDPSTEKSYMRYTVNYQHPMWGFTSSFLTNIDGFGFYHNEKQLIKRGLTGNIYEAAINGNNVYVIDNYLTYKKEKYLDSYYSDNGESFTYELISQINEYKIYKITTDE